MICFTGLGGKKHLQLNRGNILIILGMSQIQRGVIIAGSLSKAMMQWRQEKGFDLLSQTMPTSAKGRENVSEEQNLICCPSTLARDSGGRSVSSPETQVPVHDERTDTRLQSEPRAIPKRPTSLEDSLHNDCDFTFTMS